jgi:predicted nucleotidyltransferase
MDNKLKIIQYLNDNKEGIHIRELSRKVKTGIPNIKRYLDIFEKEKILSKQNKGKLVNYTLNYNEKTFCYLKQIHSYNFLNLPIKIQLGLSDFLDELKNKPLIFLVFGSYAKHNYTKNSDLDIFLVYQNIKGLDEINIVAKNISGLINVKLNVIYVNYSNFKNQFLDKNDHFSNEIRNQIIILIGVEYFYQLLGEFRK